MIRNEYLLIILIWTLSISGHANDKEGFDEVCKIYTEAKNSNMTMQSASEYILGNISKRVESKEALLAHEAMIEAMADKRYSLFKGSAEYILNQKWNCPAMESLMGKKEK